MNHTSIKPFAIGCAIAISAISWAPVTQAQPAASPPAMSKETMQHPGGGSEGMKHSMMSGMDGMQKMPMSGDTDKDFAMMMKMHHQQGVEMAQMELKDGKSPEMKSMARKIISAQKKEIGEFDRWLSKQK